MCSVKKLSTIFRRQSSPTRKVELEVFFGRGSTALCIMFYETIDASMDGREDDFVLGRRTLCRHVQRPTRAVCWRKLHFVGFIKATGIFVARPGKAQQQSIHSGHKSTPGLKLHSILMPDGRLFHLNGPIKGRRHDITLYRE